MAATAEKTNEVNELARLADATKTLAEVSTAKEACTLARTAEAARRYAQMRGLGHEAINYATGIKAKAMILLADLVDAGQADGTIRGPGNPNLNDDQGSLSISELLETDNGVDGEFGAELRQLSRDERPQAVADLRGQGMSTRW